MILAPLMLSLGFFAGPAHAGKGPDLRLKYSTDIVEVASDKVEVDGSVQEGSEVRQNTIAILDHDNRFEVTKMLGDGFEVGGIIGMSQTRGTVGDNEDPPDRHVALMATGAFNTGLGQGMRFFAQPLLGIDYYTVDAGEDSEQKYKFNVVGADVGIRKKLNKKVTFDVAAEGLYGVGKFSVGGESDDEVRLKHTELGLRAGLSVRL
jgi:hypothetical protein